MFVQVVLRTTGSRISGEVGMPVLATCVVGRAGLDARLAKRKGGPIDYGFDMFMTEAKW